MTDSTARQREMAAEALMLDELERQNCRCGADGSGEQHEPWCPWVAITAALQAAERRGIAKATEEMKLAGARSIRDTMHATNFCERASKCWDAMMRAAAAPAKP